MTHPPEDWIGLRIRQYRKRADMTQGELATAVGLSRPMISRIEQGDRAVIGRAALISFAEALGVFPDDLTATPAHARSEPERVIKAAVPLIRSALDGAEQVEPVPLDVLRADLHAAMGARMSCDYPALADMLAPLIARTLDLAEGGEPPAYGLHARALVTASLSLRPLGQTLDLATRLAERAQWAAGHADDPSAVAAAEYARAQCSLSGGVRGLRGRSLDLATRAADSIQHVAGDATRSWYVMLHTHAGLAAATLGRDEDAAAHIAEAESVSRTVRSDPDLMDVGTANVGVWRVATLLESRDPGRAPEAARKVNRSRLRTTQRLAHLLTHTGHAYFLTGNHPAAVRAFLMADEVAPAEVRGRPRVREAVGAMARAERRKAGSAALRKLAANVGVDPLASVND